MLMQGAAAGSSCLPKQAAEAARQGLRVSNTATASEVCNGRGFLRPWDYEYSFLVQKRTNQMVAICISEKSALDSVTVLEFYCTFPTLAVPAGLNTFLKEDLKITF